MSSSPPYTCCGRPALSKGFLESAKKKAHKLIHQLLPFAEQNIPIIGLEPSCLFSLFDEYRDFYPELIEPLIALTTTFDSFLKKHLPLPFSISSRSVVVQGHCHQKALQGMQDTLHVLLSLDSLKIQEIPSGCCGMAGSFGYEKEHESFSKKIAESKMLPFIHSLPHDVAIIANGFSCRTQIEQSTGRKTQHLAEFLAETITC